MKKAEEKDEHFNIATAFPMLFGQGCGNIHEIVPRAFSWHFMVGLFSFWCMCAFLCFCDTCALHGRISLANCKFGHWMLIDLELRGFVVFKDQQNLVDFFCILNLSTQEKH